MPRYDQIKATEVIYFAGIAINRGFIRLNRPFLIMEDAAMDEFKGIDVANPNAVVVGLAPSKFHYEKVCMAIAWRVLSWFKANTSACKLYILTLLACDSWMKPSVCCLLTLGLSWLLFTRQDTLLIKTRSCLWGLEDLFKVRCSVCLFVWPVKMWCWHWYDSSWICIWHNGEHRGQTYHQLL